MSNYKPIPLGEYLFRRIKSLGISHILGCPGDFNLTLLDHIYNVDGLSWIGCCNELNGAYAADGYARVRDLPGVLVTTYGVGELSAMNGVAGAYAEHAGFIHIVGNTSRQLQQNKIMIHHTLEANPDHGVYRGMSGPIRSTSAFLDDEATMASEIDRVLFTAIKTRLPVYLFVPTDVVDTPLNAARLETPLDLNLSTRPETEGLIVNKILEAIEKSRKPCILADVLAKRHAATKQTRRLIELAGYPAFSTILGKGLVDETSPLFGGMYNGSMSFPGIKEAVENDADLILNIGPHLTSSNTGAFTRQIPENKLIVLHPHYCSVFGERFEGIHFIPVLGAVLQAFEKDARKFRKGNTVTRFQNPILDDSTSGPLKQSYIWQRIGRFTKPDDIVFVEVGTSQFGMPDATLAANVQYETQIYWSSIGYTVGATLGALVAARENGHKGRVILVVGDGSLQMSVQEISSYIRNGFTPTIFLINNDGYTIEREIHGPEQQYNDICTSWDHMKMLEFFGGRQKGFKSRSVEARTVEELEEIMGDSEFIRNDCIQLCEIYVDKFDVPWILRGQVDAHKARLKVAGEQQKKTWESLVLAGTFV
ncbi:hypothetical protein TWF106_004783 [Orbilia oligospora]|uniref:Pyruvate decarboxylase n=1 Tax=Orbilia oligospora TaxID=2813651 RepID=A0A6G1LS63_ORBOL|nr:hypothetical protein TWF788_001589 [Orbilia oligospora]KAF3196701.1 hypothetical protein TWF679_004538 [Orbilia oligospora]KAF3198132.1 hypothetical protein TWF106_004783 [Orbilia oligospora]KAF3215729.1 hypothetical protein TWF191_009215 [Orbilia oligospora]KAF3232866.1 hypothetical protein TWF192_002793 [Orbilia oligospora]